MASKIGLRSADETCESVGSTAVRNTLSSSDESIVRSWSKDESGGNCVFTAAIA